MSGLQNDKTKKLKAMQKAVIAIAACTTVIAVSAFVMVYQSYDAAMSRGYVEAKTPEVMDSKVILGNITVNGVDVSGLSVSEAADKLKASLDGEVAGKSLTIVCGDQSRTINLSELNYTSGFEKAAQEAYDTGRKGTAAQREAELKSLSITPKDIKAEYTFDQSLIDDVLAEFERENYLEPKNAVMKRENGQFIIEEGSSGIQADAAKASEEALALAKARTSGTVNMEILNIPPMYTASSFENSKSLIGTYSTYVTGTTGRNLNIVLAARNISETVLYPGDIFSSLEKIGPTTPELGFQPAPEIVNNKVVEGYGGGICQVSSTLYNAVLFAELEIVERRNHSLPVAYVSLGRDATLAEGYIDFRFKNDTEYPVLVESYIESNRLYTNIYGYENRPADRKIELVYNGSLSYVTLYKKILINGVVTDTVKINTSSYKTSSDTAAPADTNATDTPADDTQTTDDQTPVDPQQDATGESPAEQPSPNVTEPEIDTPAEPQSDESNNDADVIPVDNFSVPDENSNEPPPYSLSQPDVPLENNGSENDSSGPEGIYIPND